MGVRARARVCSRAHLCRDFHSAAMQWLLPYVDEDEEL